MNKPFAPLQPMTPYGYEWYFGIMCDAWVDTYNRFTAEINRATWPATRELLLNNRHKFVVQCQELMSKESE